MNCIFLRRGYGSNGSGGGGGSDKCTLNIVQGDEWFTGTLTITANNVSYTDEATVQLAAGTEVTISLTTNTGAVSVWLDGVKVLDEQSGVARSYTYVITTDTTIRAFDTYSGGYKIQIMTEGYVPPEPIPVTLTGSGNSSYCYATINGNKCYSAGTYEAIPGDVMYFSVYGRNASYKGTVTIDNSTVLSVTSQSTQTYEWTIPDNATAITINMSYTSTSTQRRGTITVTTSSSGGGGGSTTKQYAVNITNSEGHTTYCYVTINGTKYTTKQTIMVDEGTKIACTVSNGSTSNNSSTHVSLNGTKVLTGRGTYQHTVTSDCNVEFWFNDNLTIGWMYITTS